VALDIDVVLWALRGFDPERRGLAAEEITGFIARDATLSESYSHCEVTNALESLVTEGLIECEVVGDDAAADTAISGHATKTYRLATLTDSSSLLIDTSVAPEIGDIAGTLAQPGFEPALERDAIRAELDQWRRRAEAAEHLVVRVRNEIEQLRRRVHGLEAALIQQERAFDLRRSETARRAAVALEEAQNELQRLTASESTGPTPRRPLRGNWLRELPR
jgi:hypothetical protein